MSWIYYVQTFWPVIGTILPLVATAFIMWLKSQLATKAEYEALQGQVAAQNTLLAAYDGRLTAVEAEASRAPTRNHLANTLAALGERMGGMESSMKHIGDALHTQGDYVRALVENSMKQAA